MHAGVQEMDACMKIIIVGCGRVGRALVQQLNEEGNDITAIDVDASRIADVTQKYDVLGIVGNGATYDIQMEAGIEQADLMIAVTATDELNLLCCLIAKKAGQCQTIARVRNPEYSKDAKYLKEELSLAMVINPEYAAASEIARVLRFPSAIKIDTFAKGKIELLKFRIPAGCVLEDYAVKEIATRLHCDVLVCTIERGDQVLIPNGDMVLQAEDLVSIVATPANGMHFFKKIHLFSNQIRTVMLAGGGDTAYYLSDLLQKSGISVKLIEKNRERCEELAGLLPGVTVIHGNAEKKEILLEEGLENTGAFVALTNLDEENILLSLYAKSRMNGKLVTKINHPEYEEIIRKLELDSIVNSENITAESIVRFVRAMKSSVGSNVETLYTLIKGRVEAAEFLIRSQSSIVGVPLQELHFLENILIAAIFRGGKMILPRGQDTIQIGDSVIVVSRNLGLHDICDILV